ncbi:6805_t:CDS:2, partial [Racocetra persica]
QQLFESDQITSAGEIGSQFLKTTALFDDDLGLHFLTTRINAHGVSVCV